MKFDTGKFYENLSINFNLHCYGTIFTATLHEDLHAFLGAAAFHSLRMRTFYHALDQDASSENETRLYLLNSMCQKCKSGA
jgi:hypothetical protein